MDYVDYWDSEEKIQKRRQCMPDEQAEIDARREESAQEDQPEAAAEEKSTEVQPQH